MAHVYFENAYADSEGEYKESTYKNIASNCLKTHVVVNLKNLL